MRELHVGDQVYKLKVISEAFLNEAGELVHTCECSCGNVVDISATKLRYDHRHTCGDRKRHVGDKYVLTKDLIGKKFGKLTVIGPKDTHYVRVECECGTQFLAPKLKLVSGRIKSCGCDKEVPDFIGRRFGDWEVIALSPNKEDGKRRWVCKCSCGTIRDVVEYSLTKGLSKSCGHYKG